MEPFLKPCAAALLVLCLPVTPGAGAVEAGGDLGALASANAVFALDLYAKVGSEPGNLFFSPYSVSSALAMTSVGARGSTAQEMASVLHLDWPGAQSAFGRMQSRLNELGKEEGVEFSVANALWLQQDFRFLDAFLGEVKGRYAAAFRSADFRAAAEAARTEINGWVSERTRAKINDLFAPGTLDATTRMVLVNAVYFNGKWLHPFDKRRTRQAPFFPAPGKDVKVQTMNQKRKFPYAEDGQVQLLDLPYAGGELSMVVVLPRARDGLNALESDFGQEKLSAWTKALAQTEVVVSLPKFRAVSEFSLGETLASMGMREAFTRSADFSGITGGKDLFISAVVHKAFVDVNEEGTEAAAATGVAMRLTAVRSAPPKVFLADHPFLFLIRDRASGSILFMGRVVNPL